MAPRISLGPVGGSGEKDNIHWLTVLVSGSGSGIRLLLGDADHPIRLSYIEWRWLMHQLRASGERCPYPEPAKLELVALADGRFRLTRTWGPAGGRTPDVHYQHMIRLEKAQVRDLLKRCDPTVRNCAMLRM